MVKVIFNADDFGYSRAVNYGIIDCFQKGILTSTTLMVNMAGFSHAVELAKNNQIGIGIHLTLTCGKPVLGNLQTIVSESGEFKKLPFYETGEFDINQNELFEEWDAQIKKAINAGISPTHLDSHHHTHSMGKNHLIFIELARKYDLPVRNNFIQPEHGQSVRTTEKFLSDFDQVSFYKEMGKSEEDVQVFLKEKLNEILQSNSVEVMCHPAYLDQSILLGSSFSVQRPKQVEVLTNSFFADEIRKNQDIQLCTFKSI